MEHRMFGAAAWLLALLFLAGCREEPRMTVSYVCKQGHTHREVVAAERLPGGSAAADGQVGKQVECLPDGGER